MKLVILIHHDLDPGEKYYYVLYIPVISGGPRRLQLADVSEEDIDELIKGTENKKTQKSTK